LDRFLDTPLTEEEQPARHFPMFEGLEPAYRR
jgi:hypothetical protein